MDWFEEAFEEEFLLAVNFEGRICDLLSQMSQHPIKYGRGGGLVVSILDICSDNPSSILAAS